ncbi:MAG: sensor histidine kinase [Spirochaetes bacterium]|nr:sensor histidine kinase [Spirochaetota bacterium]
MILGTVRAKIIANTTLILLIIALATLYTGLASSELARSVAILFRNNLLTENISKILDQTETGLTGYLTTKSSDALKDYIMYSTRLAEEARNLNREIRADDSLLLQRDLAGLIDSYLRDTEASVTAKRGRDVEAYTMYYESSERAAELSRFLIGRMEEIFMSGSLKAFSAFNSRIPAVLASNAVLVLAAALMSFMLLVRYSYKLTSPLSRLAEAARAVGRGEYDHALPRPESRDEIATTTAAFSSMQKSIKEAFEELKSKSEVEKRLMEERLHVLDMDHKLKNAELLALQTQINPHFLFNTLSAGMQLALAEGADRTGDFLENLAAFIRYVLKPPSRLVRISDEIECVERYIWLLRLRFRERFGFEVSADKEIMEVEIPALMLQPLVENAVAHGLRDREEGGRVLVSARRIDGEAVLSVEDTGEGMSAEEIERILREGSENESLQGAGIGLRNVIRRLSLVTGGRGRIEIESSPGKGTAVRIHLPVGDETR